MKRLLIIAAGIGAVLGVSIIIGTLLPKSDRKGTPVAKTELTKFTDEKQGITLEYPKTLKASVLTADDTKDRVILRLNSTNPPALLTVRTETGLKAAAAVSKSSIVEMLVSNLQKAYPSRYPGFKLGQTRRLTVSGHSAAEIVFTYRGPAGETAKQRLLIVQQDDNTALFLAAQARETDFGTVSRDLFEPVFTSLTVQ